ncbi:hypothetical protein D3C71_786800 [compost metagenome]
MEQTALHPERLALSCFANGRISPMYVRFLKSKKEENYLTVKIKTEVNLPLPKLFWVNSQNFSV